jgi:crossover junction endodeoxyribonuclease RuvC
MYVGIDQSLNGTGLCLRDANDIVHATQTVDSGKLRDVERLAYVKARVTSFLSDRVKFVAFEGYSYNSVGRVFELGEIGGVLRLLVHEHRLSYVVIPPASLKKFATGNPRAEKEDMVEAAQRAGFDTEDDNQADAFFLSQIARCHHLELAPPNRAQLEILHSIRSPKTKKPARRIRRLAKNSI